MFSPPSHATNTYFVAQNRTSFTSYVSAYSVKVRGSSAWRKRSKTYSMRRVFKIKVGCSFSNSLNGFEC